jgi:hypothetical protein
MPGGIPSSTFTLPFAAQATNVSLYLVETALPMCETGVGS